MLAAGSLVGRQSCGTSLRHQPHRLLSNPADFPLTSELSLNSAVLSSGILLTAVNVRTKLQPPASNTGKPSRLPRCTPTKCLLETLGIWKLARLQEQEPHTKQSAAVLKAKFHLSVTSSQLKRSSEKQIISTITMIVMVIVIGATNIIITAIMITITMAVIIFFFSIMIMMNPDHFGQHHQEGEKTVLPPSPWPLCRRSHSCRSRPRCSHTSPPPATE